MQTRLPSCIQIAQLTEGFQVLALAFGKLLFVLFS